jgi:hypothetical protein
MAMMASMMQRRAGINGYAEILLESISFHK